MIPGGTGKISDVVFMCPFYEDDLGAPARMAQVAFLTTSTVQINTLSLKGGQWVYSDGVDSFDTSITIGVTSSNLSRMHAFAIDSPGTSTDRVVFIMTHDVAGAPDTFAMRSIIVPDDVTSMTNAAAVTIAGANAPPDGDLGGGMSVAVGTNRIMTFVQDDIYFGDITGSGPFTVTYTDAPVLVWDSNADLAVNNAKRHTAWCIGGRVIHLRAGASISSNLPFTPALWELDTAGLVVSTHNPFHVASMGSNLDLSGLQRPTIFPSLGTFKVANPFATNDATRTMAYMLTDLPIDDL
jgi:hypothetical protein